MTDNLFQIQLLMESGGMVLWLILIASVLMWTLIIERYVYMFFRHPKEKREVINHWNQRHDRRSWYAQQIRQGMIAENRIRLERYLMLIKTLTMALPMLGLLGTVNGMIQTFDVMTVFGTGNTRGMAGGISIALITTMGGLLTALSGLYFSTQLQQQVTRTVDNVADALRRD
ncbi:Ferric siderophore transport system, biopolymer transport protein ExbB [Methylophaga frappieri]|uniref:Ferric siderophore transport system, biopolymer transport protein ExbB n=1 Tax=Methylophaga frappieri (strain ATCC BAA-2434 / DSM 25690 / JAM7) TaxID=754477 RepID=I1YHZ5_METFJ|nr:MotA/TolQ/ExbB proton channel family protein [Methylophaga frappieri]AFJ02538.1 Ferric siderophore transport system, biopolymer transport protein ExbB [Methylophaga frappieri]